MTQGATGRAQRAHTRTVVVMTPNTHLTHQLAVGACRESSIATTTRTHSDGSTLVSIATANVDADLIDVICPDEPTYEAVRDIIAGNTIGGTASAIAAIQLRVIHSDGDTAWSHDEKLRTATGVCPTIADQVARLAARGVFGEYYFNRCVIIERVTASRYVHATGIPTTLLAHALYVSGAHHASTLIVGGHTREPHRARANADERRTTDLFEQIGLTRHHTRAGALYVGHSVYASPGDTIADLVEQH